MMSTGTEVQPTSSGRLSV